LFVRLAGAVLNLIHLLVELLRCGDRLLSLHRNRVLNATDARHQDSPSNSFFFHAIARSYSSSAFIWLCSSLVGGNLALMASSNSVMVMPHASALLMPRCAMAAAAYSSALN